MNCFPKGEYPKRDMCHTIKIESAQTVYDFNLPLVIPMLHCLQVVHALHSKGIV